jgi:hypothetical protein
MSADITQFVEFPPQCPGGKSTNVEFGGFAVPPWIGHNSWQRRAAMETQMSDKFTYNNGRK